MADNQAHRPLRSIFHIGRITAAHGLGGEVRVQVLSSDPDRFKDLKQCLLLSANEQDRRLVLVEHSRIRGRSQLVKLAGINDRDAAEALRGMLLSVEREQALKLEEDEYFVSDLIGCSVFDQAEGYLGTVGEILAHQAQDVYVIRQQGLPDLLFPALKSILLVIDLATRTIKVKLPEGLFELYRERKI